MIGQLRERWGRQVNRFSESEKQLYLFAQPHISLAFLRAKRDTSADRALQHLVDAQAELLPAWGGSEGGSNDTSGSNPEMLRIRLMLRRAELLLFRSDMPGAACCFVAAVKGLRRRIGNAPAVDAAGAITPLSLLAYALSGLGDAIAALDLTVLYAGDATSRDQASEPAGESSRCRLAEALRDGYGRAKEMASPKALRSVFPSGLMEGLDALLEDIERSIGDEHADRPTWMEGVGRLRNPEPRADCQLRDLDPSAFAGRTVEAYALSAIAYQHAGRASEAALSLWKIAYFTAFGLSYWIEGLPRPGQGAGKAGEQTALGKDWRWVFDQGWRNQDFERSSFADNPVHRCATQAFHGAYRVQRARLRELGVLDPRVLKWVSPPLSQSLIVLGAWVHALIDDDNDALAQDSYPVREMGAFPVYPRILAAFLKGRWYYKQAFGVANELPPRILRWRNDNEEFKREIRQGFRFLVDAAEDGEAYEGGLEMLNPPLGFIYFHLWLTVRAASRGRDWNDALLELEASDEFLGERMRFFQADYLKSKAQSALSDMLARHGRNEGFYTYASKHCYLMDAFSDPFVNGLWAVDHGLQAVARKMLRTLDDET